MSLTDRDFEKLEEKFATKDFLRKELERFATKDFLKSELERFATKKDLESLTHHLYRDFALKEDVTFLKEEFHEFKGEMISRFDWVVKKIEDLTMEMKLSFGQYRRQEDKLENHEHRIQTPEIKLA